MSEEEWTDILNINLTGTLRACQIFGRHMLERGYGRIINIASLSSFVGFKEVAAYAASKAGVVSLTQSLAVEWSKQGVTASALVHTMSSTFFSPGARAVRAARANK